MTITRFLNMSQVEIMFRSTLKYTEGWHFKLLSAFQRIFYACLALETVEKRPVFGIQRFWYSEGPVFRVFTVLVTSTPFTTLFLGNKNTACLLISSCFLGLTYCDDRERDKGQKSLISCLYICYYGFILWQQGTCFHFC
jgi:hypothetical protein